MISPPFTRWPAKTFTPSRWPGESRPFRLEPSPFLCAISSPLSGNDLGDLHLGQLLPVALPAHVPGLRLELEDPHLRPPLVGNHLRLDPRPGHGGADRHTPIVLDEKRFQLDGVAD